MKKSKKQPKLNWVIKTVDAQRKHILDRDYNTDMLFGNLRHWCPKHGNIAIDDTMVEFETCDCNLYGFE